jgi:hypothetical protein|mmetsp:Transcript_11042/g.34252  ORF Transcript_11042/g.34252 Transcript_11042/m.34252 type:complete len:294 (-) Transcript_11042:170-1051(-)
MPTIESDNPDLSIHRCLDAYYPPLKKAVGDLEGARLEVDARRRRVASLRARTERLRARLDEASVGTDGGAEEGRLQKAFQGQRHKEAKLAAAQSAFDSLEAECYESLAALSRDSELFRSYVDTAVVLQREAFGSLVTPALGNAALSAAEDGGEDAPVADSDSGVVSEAAGSLPRGYVPAVSMLHVPPGTGEPLSPQEGARTLAERYHHISHSPWPGEYEGSTPIDWTESEGEGPAPRWQRGMAVPAAAARRLMSTERSNSGRVLTPSLDTAHLAARHAFVEQGTPAADPWAQN